MNADLLPAAAICELASVSHSKYLKWLSLKVVRQPSAEGCSLTDCVELALAQTLAGHLARLEAIRTAMSQLVDGISVIPDVGSLDIVYEARFGTARWITNSNDLAIFARRYRRILVVDVRSLVDDVRRGFARRAADRSSRQLRVVKSRTA